MKRHFPTNISLLLLVLAATTATTTTTNVCIPDVDPDKQAPATSCDRKMETTTEDEECTLYMAPSTIPGAGLGVFTTKELQEGTLLGEFDDMENTMAPFLQELFIPIQDQLKVLPHRGQQRFLSWLGYVFPREPHAMFPTFDENSFPRLPKAMLLVDEGLDSCTNHPLFYNEENDGDGDEDDDVSAFVPGIASLVNSDPILWNLQPTEEYYASSNKFGGGVSFQTTKDIDAGSELFWYYGAEWHENYYSKHYQSQTEFDTLEDYKANFLPDLDLPNEHERRTLPEHLKLQKEFVLEPRILTKETSATETNDKKPAEKKTPENKFQMDDQTREEFKQAVLSWNAKLEALKTDAAFQKKRDKTNKVSWLKQNGLCMDRLLPGPSTVRQADNGAFAKHKIPKGSVIAPSPLLALKRDDLVIYEKIVKEVDGEEEYRSHLDFENIKGYEKLLNYAYGHKDSPLLLVPYGPTVNFINHGSGQKANAEIRWPSKASPLFHGLLTSEDWLQLHPLDVVDHSGKLLMEFVALRDIQPGEEIFIDYGPEWAQAYQDHMKIVAAEGVVSKPFRHEIGVPDGFFPPQWLHKSAVFEPNLPSSGEDLKPGQMVPLVFAHNGMPVAKVAYAVGLPTGFSDYMRQYSNDQGITEAYRQLLFSPKEILGDNEWFLFDNTPQTEKWFAQRYESKAWEFNIHYIAPWDEAARQSMIAAHGSAGFDAALEGIGNRFGLDNMTCIHTSFMGISEAETSFTHADVYATGGKGFNINYPIVTVDGSDPELDIVADNTNIIVSVNYRYDMAYVLGDYGYHRTSANHYEKEGKMRIVVNLYCAQVDEVNADMMKYLYDGENPAPFMDQFEQPMKEIHWSRDHGHSLSKATL